jgi:hypothetical protein
MRKKKGVARKSTEDSRILLNITDIVVLIAVSLNDAVLTKGPKELSHVSF